MEGKEPLGGEQALPDWMRPEAWIRAEAQMGRLLVEAAVAVARVDERLRRMPGARRAASLERIALIEAGDLLWAEGQRLRPEALALAARGRAGRAWDTEQAVSRAAWSVRRLIGPHPELGSPQGVRTFLGLKTKAEGDPEAEEIDRDELWLRGLDEGDLREWCSTLNCLEDVHPLTRAAAGFHIWRGLMLTPPGRILEPATVASRLAASSQYGLRSVPLVFENPRGLPAVPGPAADKLNAWLQALSHAAQRVQLVLDRLQRWSDEIARRTQKRKGGAIRGLAELLASRPIVSAQDAAAELGVTATQARVLLRRLADETLVRELTGHSRFRFWAAPLSSDGDATQALRQDQPRRSKPDRGR